MKVLFVSSGNSGNFEITPFIKTQGDSIAGQGVEVSYFTIRRKGLWGYIKGAAQLRKHLKTHSYDIIHAHYTLSGLSAVLAFPRQPIVLSLMGTDAYGDYIGVNKIKFSSWYLKILTKLIQPFVSKLICKSEHIQSFVYLKDKSVVIPNGIMLNRFLVNRKGYRSELGLAPQKKYILFLGDKENIRKNYALAKEAYKYIQQPSVELIAPYPVQHDKVIKYLNSVDCLVVPSLMEGSPNIVKEAMACNCPTVATRVGDIEWLFDNEPGHFLSSFNAEELSQKIKDALNFSQEHQQTQGRKRIVQLGLDSETIARRIINVYQEILPTNE